MQRQLVAADDYWRWMDSLLPGVSADAAQQAWIRHAQARLAPSDLALPAQDILLVCEATDGERTSLYRYDVQAAAWGTEIENHIFMSVGAVPDGNGDLVLDRLRQMRQTRALLGGAENAERLLTQPMTGDLFRIGTAGLGLLVYAHDAFEPFTSFQRLETAACADGQCETTGVLIGRPVWSPDGTRTLIAAQDGTVWLGDDRGRLLQPVGVGAAPFWLDNDSYGFLRPDGEQTQALTEIAVATVATHAPETWLRMETLAAEISAETDPSQFTINTAVASTDNPDLLFVAVSTVNYENAYVFVVNRLTGEAQLQAATDYSFNRYTPFGASPEARWVTMNAFDRRSAAWQLHLIDSRTGDTQTLTSAYPFSVRSYDWSPDDQWLMRIQDGYLHLLAPDAGDQMILNHPYSGCLFAAWAES
jgi:dipeptidyl aminopeptidase/acylaminoacyl peptidase